MRETSKEFISVGYKGKKSDRPYKDPIIDNDIPSISQSNGNISQIWYQVRGRNPEAYGYQYDYLDRLTKARHIATTSSGARIINGYNEEIGYADARGNISSIYRTGMAYTSATQATQGVIDNLIFAYTANTNKLSTVTESATDPTLKAKGFNPGSNSTGYTYDASGNLTSDSYKGISSIAYNHLHLPGQVNFSNGAKIVFTYAANGIKLRKQVYSNATTITSTTDYLDGIEYINNKPEAIYHPEGRAYNTTPAGATPTWRYEYNIKDHLGNNRISFSDLNGNGSISNNEILQEQHYYPFGMVQEGAWMNNAASDDSRYTYNGKEFNGEVGWYDYGARWYDAGVGRWTSVDPHAERYPSWTPYNYVYNNPINGIDPDGRDGILIVFPNYKVDTETRLGKQPLGHAGVLLIDNKTGYTKYYEYGRYQTDDGTKGKVRTIAVPNVVIGEDGKPTQESLNKILGRISEKAGQGGAIEGAYVEGDFTKMNDYAQEKLKESNPQYKEYDKDRKPYSLTGNNCGTFGCDVLKQDSDAKKKAPWIFNPTPNNIAEEYQDNFPAVNYDPKTKTTTSEIYKKKEE